MDIIEDLKEIDLDEPPKKASKIVLIILGIIGVFLMISFIFVTYPISGIIKGKLDSTLLENNQLKLDTFSIIFEDNSAQILESMYYEEQKNEFSVCLSGEKIDGDYYIDSLYQPAQRRSFNQVSFESCSPETLMILHTHPYKRCAASSADLVMLAGSKERNEDVLMVVMCEPDRFSVYT